MLAWESLSAVAVGPVVARRAQRQIDFAPTRPQLIERAIKAQPQGATAFERVGMPAKGLPALEWLLWTQPAQPASPACSYAVEVALDVEREAVAQQAAFREAAQTDWAAEDQQERSTQAMGEFINQWVGGIERLRWAHMEKPLRAAQGARDVFGQGGRHDAADIVGLENGGMKLHGKVPLLAGPHCGHGALHGAGAAVHGPVERMRRPPGNGGTPSADSRGL